MIAKILARIDRDACTKDMLAQELGIRKNVLTALLEFMVHGGYLGEVSCESKCSGYSLKCSIPIPLKMYAITQKGIAYLKNKRMYK